MAKVFFDLLCVGLLGAGVAATLFDNELVQTIGYCAFFTGVGGFVVGDITKRCMEAYRKRKNVVGIEERKRIVDGLDENIESLMQKRKDMTDGLFEFCKEAENKLNSADEKIERLECEKKEMEEKNRQNEDALIQKEEKIKDLERAMEEKEKKKAMEDEKMLNELERLKAEVRGKDGELQRMREMCLEKERIQNEEVEELRKINLEEKRKVKDLQVKNRRLRQELSESESDENDMGTKTESQKYPKFKRPCCRRLKLECARKDRKIKDLDKSLKNLQTEKDEKSEEVVRLRNDLEKKNEDTNQAKVDKLLKEGLFAYMDDKINDAMNKFEKILSMDVSNEENALLHVLLAKTKSAFDNPDHLEIILDCCKAIEKGLKGRRVHVLRGEHLCKHGLYDAALEDFELALRHKKSEDCLRNLNEAKKKQQMWEGFNHYEVLGVKQNASMKEIQIAHKNLAMKYHPDRHRNKPKFLQEAFERKYKRICNAKAVLTDEQEREKYNQELRRRNHINNQQHHRQGREPTGHNHHNPHHPRQFYYQPGQRYGHYDFADIFDFVDAFFRF